MRRHVYFYTLIDRDLPAASAVFTDDPTLWLPAPALPVEDGYAVDLSAQGVVPRALAQHRVTVTLGPATEEAGRVLRPVTWRSATAPGIFPVLDGDLELVGLGGGGCHLSLMGTYRPPLSVAGTAADALLGHHVAEACVRRFVLDAANRMGAVTLSA